MRHVLAAAVVAASLAGCATLPEDPTLAAEAGRPVVCSGREDCEVKWSRALQWTLNNSAYRLQIQSDAMIATFGPLPNDPRPAVTITKIAQGGGAYTFDFRAGCDNMFGCVPSLIALKGSFVRAVMGAEPPPAPPATGDKI